MDEAIRCRWAQVEDFEAVENLSAQLAQHLDEPPPLLARKDFRAFYVGSQAPMKLLLAERRGGQVIGLVSWTVVQALYSGEGGLYISDLVIDRATRGQGVGRILMDVVKAWARTAGIGKLGWDVWRANASAKAFYETLGASVDEEALPYRLILEDA